MFNKERSWGHNDHIDRYGRKYGDKDYSVEDKDNYYLPARNISKIDNFNPDPGFYQMYKDKDGNHSIELVSPTRKVPDNIYGKTGVRVLRYWKKFTKADSTIGILLVGDSGSGKSMESDILCNVAIKKGEMPVLGITGFEVNEQTIQFIEQYDNVCLYFDEFSKHVKYNVQELLLSLLTNPNKRYLVVMTENDINTISAYLRSRPGRAWYRKIFDKLELDVVEDYLTQFPTVKDTFKEELLNKYKSAMVFTFDHLKAIIAEHLDYPDETLDEMLELLNVDIFSKSKKYYLTKLEELIPDTEDEYKSIEYMDAVLEPYQVEQDRYTLNIFVKPIPVVDAPGTPPVTRGMFGGYNNNVGEEIKFNIGNLIERDGATHIFRVGKYRFTLVKTDQNMNDKIGNVNRPNMGNSFRSGF